MDLNLVQGGQGLSGPVIKYSNPPIICTLPTWIVSVNHPYPYLFVCIRSLMTKKRTIQIVVSTIFIPEFYIETFTVLYHFL